MSSVIQLNLHLTQFDFIIRYTKLSGGTKEGRNLPDFRQNYQLFGAVGFKGQDTGKNRSRKA